MGTALVVAACADEITIYDDFPAFGVRVAGVLTDSAGAPVAFSVVPGRVTDVTASGTCGSTVLIRGGGQTDFAGRFFAEFSAEGLQGIGRGCLRLEATVNGTIGARDTIVSIRPLTSADSLFITLRLR